MSGQQAAGASCPRHGQHLAGVTCIACDSGSRGAGLPIPRAVLRLALEHWRQLLDGDKPPEPFGCKGCEAIDEVLGGALARARGEEASR